MPSPFPGMDPFLEAPGEFADFHDSLITYLRECINGRLPPPYFTKIGTRLFVEFTQREIQPDVHVVRPTDGAPVHAEEGGGAAVAVKTRTEPIVVRLPQDEVRQPYLQIFKLDGGTKRLVTHLEVLSLSNKTPGQKMRSLYKRKQKEILDSEVHLVEIDLLRGGVHATALPQSWAVNRAGPFDYHVCVHRYDMYDDFLLYPFQLQDSLPEFALPLLPGDRDIAVDLQVIFQRCYDTGPYARSIDYSAGVPPPPLSAEKEAWVQGTLRSKGLVK